jgi:hypothetical protein
VNVRECTTALSSCRSDRDRRSAKRNRIDVTSVDSEHVVSYIELIALNGLRRWIVRVVVFLIVLIPIVALGSVDNVRAVRVRVRTATHRVNLVEDARFSWPIFVRPKVLHVHGHNRVDQCVVGGQCAEISREHFESVFDIGLDTFIVDIDRSSSTRIARTLTEPDLITDSRCCFSLSQSSVSSVHRF